MKDVDIGINFDLLKLPTLKERIKVCEDKGRFYIGEGYHILEEDYWRVIRYFYSKQYGEDIE